MIFVTWVDFHDWMQMSNNLHRNSDYNRTHCWIQDIISESTLPICMPCYSQQTLQWTPNPLCKMDHPAECPTWRFYLWSMGESALSEQLGGSLEQIRADLYRRSPPDIIYAFPDPAVVAALRNISKGFRRACTANGLHMAANGTENGKIYTRCPRGGSTDPVPCISAVSPAGADSSRHAGIPRATSRHLARSQTTWLADESRRFPVCRCAAKREDELEAF